MIRTFGPRIPTFGVCLGHQCIGHTFGGNVIVNYRMMHGKTSLIKHNGKDLFAGMPNPFAATRYHSLVIERASVPDCLEITAETEEGASPSCPAARLKLPASATRWKMRRWRSRSMRSDYSYVAN